MARLLTSPEMLEALIPNRVAVGRGETSIYSKISEFIEIAENWVIQSLAVPESLISRYSGRLARIAAIKTIIIAAPSLDVVFHPSGMAVINTDSLVPASKDRAERLISSLEEILWDEICGVLNFLEGEIEWPTASSPFELSLCRTPMSVKLRGGSCGSLDEFTEVVTKLRALEDELADLYISHEVMDYLYANRINYISVSYRISSYLLRLINKNAPLDETTGLKILSLIKCMAELRNIWNSTQQAAFYNAPKFQNNRNNSGYFFS